MRTCSYDRAGYGFSELGNDLRRDLEHDVADLHDLLRNSNEPAPYILVGHSNGGRIIGAFADLYRKEVAAMVFLDAAVVLDMKQIEGPAEPISPAAQARRNKELQNLRECLKRAEDPHVRLVAKSGDACLDPSDFKTLSPTMAEAEMNSEAKPDFWRAYLSETQNNYASDDDMFEKRLLPHRWTSIPIRVFIASVASLSDAESAHLYGLSSNDHIAITQAREGRAKWERMQARLCEFSKNCQIFRIPTADHYLQELFPKRSRHRSRRSSSKFDLPRRARPRGRDSLISPKRNRKGWHRVSLLYGLIVMMA